jgi:hypothetical protein
MTREITSTSKYRDVLLKLIPSEIIAAYMVIDGLLPAEQPSAKWLALAAGIALAILTPAYLIRIYSVKDWSQVLFTTGTFAVWVYWMGGPFELWGIHNQAIGSVVLVLWTLLVPLLNVPSKFVVGQVVQIPPKRPDDVIAGSYMCAWHPDMNRFLGERAIVTRINRRRETAKLDVDSGAYVWSFTWLEAIENDNGGENGAAS